MINPIESTEWKRAWRNTAVLLSTLLFFGAIFLISAFLFHRQVFLLDEANLHYLSELRWWRQVDNKQLTLATKLPVTAILITFGLHLASGIYYFTRLLNGGNFR